MSSAKPYSQWAKIRKKCYSDCCKLAADSRHILLRYFCDVIKDNKGKGDKGHSDGDNIDKDEVSKSNKNKDGDRNEILL